MSGTALGPGEGDRPLAWLCEETRWLPGHPGVLAGCTQWRFSQPQQRAVQSIVSVMGVTGCFSKSSYGYSHVMMIDPMARAAKRTERVTEVYLGTRGKVTSRVKYSNTSFENNGFVSHI